LLGELDDVALLEEDLLQRQPPLVLAAGEKLEVHREVEELLALRVLHDPAGFLVRLDRHPLLVPADRLRLLLQRGDHAGERAGVGAELAWRLVILIRRHARTIADHRAPKKVAVATCGSVSYERSETRQAEAGANTWWGPVTRLPARHAGLPAAAVASACERPALEFVRSALARWERMAVEVVGRDEELSSLHAFLDRRVAGQGPIAFALEGEAGIGKSTLWRAAVEEARGRGVRVLSSRPAESESALAYAGLGDLFEGVLDDVLPDLTAPRRRALEVALLVEDAAGRPVDQRALGVAVRSALELLAADPLVLAIDDLQWLDASSASALGFALRRLPETNIVLLWTRRVGEREPASPVENALDPERIEHLRVGPLSVGAIHRILRSLLDRAVPRPTLLRLHEVSGGNPFYALELARALGAGGAVHGPTQPLPVPARLEELVSARLDGFSGATREALVLASADARLTPDQLDRAGIEQSALDPALGENVLELGHGTVRFSHPLLASVLYQGLSVGERQRAHRRLAELAEDPVARARHLALSTERPDAELAAVLEGAAEAAAAQGAPITAGELGEHAVRLTPSSSRADVDRRAAAAVRAHLAAGDVERGRVLATELAARALAGADRAEALFLLAETEDMPLAIPLLKEALREPGAPAALKASVHQRLSLDVRFMEGLDAAEEHALAAVGLAEELGDVPLHASALGGLALIRFNAGKLGALELAEQAYGLAADDSAAPPVADAGFALGHILVWSGHFDRARALLEMLYRDWSERDERLAAYGLWYLALVELRSGKFSLAAEYAEQSRALSAQYVRDEAESPQSLFPSALVAAHRGDLPRARELAQRSCVLSDLHAARLQAPSAILGLVELWRGDPNAAVASFATAERTPDAADGIEPGMTWWRAEQVEALLELGLVDDAVARLDAWEAEARRLGRDWVLAHATRCRGLVAASRGDVENALSLLAEAVAGHESVNDSFGRARALLALGVTRRRARQKRPAREAIEAARAGFEDLEAAGWAERARLELGAIGGRTRSDGLTPAERRVADLVASGRTNAEVAATLFLAERTVASHLTHVYAKLGVRSRTELARRLG
jgi:DNA-binding CsgD family transcriptional regulator